MNDSVDVFFGQQAGDGWRVADVAMHESKPRVLYRVRKAREIAGIGQRIEYDDAVVRVLRQPVVDEVCADEAGTARYEQTTHDIFSSISRRLSRHGV